MNIRKFNSLNDQLQRLLSEQLNLFLLKRGLLDWLAEEQMIAKYPNVKESKRQNKLAILSTIEELQTLLGSKEFNLYGQQGIFD